MEGLNKFIATISIPALFFLGLATLNASSLDFSLFAALTISKTLVYIGTCIVTYSLSADAGADRFGLIGIFGIFTTQSNDIALGLPIVAASFGEEYGTYIFLLAPVQLLFLNLMSLILMEITTQKKIALGSSQGAEINNSSIACTVFTKLLKSPIVMSCILGLFINVTAGPENIPFFFKGLLQILSKTYAGCALFSLGLSIDPNVKGGNPLGIAVLVSTKVILMPMIMAILARLMTNNETATQFAFIYGMLPTAPTAYILAVAYGIQEALLSTACLVVLISSLPMLLIAAAALNATSESDMHKNNEVSIGIAYWVSSLSLCGSFFFLVMMFLARSQRPIVGPWRIVGVIGVITSALMGVHLACLDYSGKEISRSQAVGLHLWETGFQLLVGAYGLVLCATLYARLVYDEETVLKTEKYGHIASWLGVLFISLIFCIPGVVPTYEDVDENDADYTQSILHCTTRDPAAFQVIKFLFQLAISGASIYLIIKYQYAISAEQESGHEPIPDQKLKNGVQSSTTGFRKDEKAVSLLSADQLKEDSSEVVAVQAEPHSEVDDKFEDSMMEPKSSSAIVEMKVLDRTEDADYNFEPKASSNSTRYTLIVFFLAFGVVLETIISISEMAHASSDAPAYSQVVFVLYLCFRMSVGIFIFGLWAGEKHMFASLKKFYVNLIARYPWIERTRLYLLSQFTNLDVMPGVIQNVANPVGINYSNNPFAAAPVTEIREMPNRVGAVMNKLGVYA